MMRGAKVYVALACLDCNLRLRINVPVTHKADFSLGTSVFLGWLRPLVCGIVICDRNAQLLPLINDGPLGDEALMAPQFLSILVEKDLCGDDLDLVLIMSVYPGFGGQKFIPATVERLHTLQSLVKNRNHDLLIQVDGGIDSTTIPLVLEAGANVLVIGSAIFRQKDIGTAVEQFRDVIKNHEL